MRVLVALDTSNSGESAAVAIAPWARACGANVLLMTVRHPGDIHGINAPTGYVHVLTPQGTVSGTPLRGAVEPGPVAVEDRTQALERDRVEAEEYLLGVAARDLKGIACEVHVEWSEQTAAAIVRCAEEKKADLIAIGTHGRSGMTLALLGSVADAVVRGSPVPVVLVRGGMRLAADE
jgi:nucleotide-binding universal stress UspA family protein